MVQTPAPEQRSSNATAIAFKDTFHFDPAKEHRGTYLVEYHVPIDGNPFATLFLVFLEPMQAQVVAEAMENELERWSRRYPVPIMVSAFTDTDDVIDLQSSRPESHLIGWVDSNGGLHAHWRLLKNEEFPSGAYSSDQLLAIYSDIPHHRNTAEQKRQSIHALVLQNRFLTATVVIWLVVVPVTIAIVGMANFWVGLTATVYAVAQGLWQLSGLLGWRQESKRQLQKEAEERKMRHHHYWCGRNPSGFARLMGEAIDKENRERLRKEAEELGESGKRE